MSKKKGKSERRKSKTEIFIEESKKNGTYQVIDMEKVWADKKKREEKEEEDYKKAVAKEVKRVKSMKCPVCDSTKKYRNHKTKNNGIMGPGFHSTTITDHYICQGCGVHYTDLKKKDIKAPWSSRSHRRR